MTEDAHAAEQHSGRFEPPLTGSTPVRGRQPAGSWLYSIDPGYDPDGAVPPHAVIGAWPVDAHGGAGEFVTNPDYRPSPLSLLFSDPAAGPDHAPGLPTDPVDAAMRAAASGQGSQATVLAALAGATVYLPADATGEPTTYQDEDGPYVTVLTDPRQAPPTASRLLPLDSAGLLALLPRETALWINPESDVSMGLSTVQLRETLANGAADPLPCVPPTGQSSVGR
ncbi:type VII secretion system-associated protein [Streptomyces sp. NBC_01476]|uniref:type VII secretion system-associated protein n=1 Tax=Streptomyces sp. NBC_01476 TaxID=2903881 RepID=UPI002E334483|nr:type VII secretion system-associated protein [Streptomyces sp. NBC_01476]